MEGNPTLIRFHMYGHEEGSGDDVVNLRTWKTIYSKNNTIHIPVPWKGKKTLYYDDTNDGNFEILDEKVDIPQGDIFNFGGHIIDHVGMIKDADYNSFIKKKKQIRNLKRKRDLDHGDAHVVKRRKLDNSGGQERITALPMRIIPVLNQNNNNNSLIGSLHDDVEGKLVEDSDDEELEESDDDDETENIDSLRCTNKICKNLGIQKIWRGDRGVEVLCLSCGQFLQRNHHLKTREKLLLDMARLTPRICTNPNNCGETHSQEWITYEVNETGKWLCVLCGQYYKRTGNHRSKTIIDCYNAHKLE